MSMQEDVNLLYPEGKDVTVNSKTYKVKPFSLVQFPKVLKLFEEVAQAALPEDKKELMTILVLRHSDKIIPLITIALKEEQNKDFDMQMDEAMDVLQAILEVNGGFFVQRLLPKLSTVLGALSKLVTSTSSKGLLVPGMPTTK